MPSVVQLIPAINSYLKTVKCTLGDMTNLTSISLKSLLLVKSRHSTAFFYSQSRYYKAQAIELSGETHYPSIPIKFDGFTVVHLTFNAEY